MCVVSQSSREEKAEARVSVTDALGVCGLSV